jgi:subtilisin family serine protease
LKLVDFHITNLSKRIDNEVDPQIVTEMDTTVAASFGIIPRACKLGLVLFSLLTIYDLHLVAAFDYKVYTVVLKNLEKTQVVNSLPEMHDQFLEMTLKPLGHYQKLYSYTHAIAGFSVHMSSAQAKLLRTLPQVLQVSEDRRVKTQTTHSYIYLGLPQGPWAALGGVEKAGEGVVIGVIDSGIFPDHPSFYSNTTTPYLAKPNGFNGSCDVSSYFPSGSCNGKLLAAQHFFRAAILSQGINATSPGRDYGSPFDLAGHGTHVSGTSGGNNNVSTFYEGNLYGFASGMAPRAWISTYKALDQTGFGYNSDVIAAVDKAIQDGVDILNLSLGSGPVIDGEITFLDALELALLGAVKHGIFVSKAAGNDGPSDVTVSSFSPWIMTVAASIIDRTYPKHLVLGNGQSILGVGEDLSPGTTTASLVFARDVLLRPSPGLDCLAGLDPIAVEGQLLVCTWDGTLVSEFEAVLFSASTAQSLLAVGVVLIYNFNTTITPQNAMYFYGFPGLSISGADAINSVTAYYNSRTTKSPNGEIIFGASGQLTGGIASYNGSPPVVSDFSSRGPVIDFGVPLNYTKLLPLSDVLKPNILAPGEKIWAAWSSVQGTEVTNFIGQRFAYISGTSMATPHIAGSAALLKQLHPTWSPAAIASALLTTAFSTDATGQPLQANDYTINTNTSEVTYFRRPANPFDLGSGFVNVTAATDPGLIFDAGFTDYVNFLCSVPSITPENVKVIGGTCPRTRGLPSDLNAASITVGHLIGSRRVPRNVTNVGTSNETYLLTVTAPRGVNVTVAPTTFTIVPGKTQQLLVTLQATETGLSLSNSSFGLLTLTGNLGHLVKVPITVGYKSIA